MDSEGIVRQGKHRCRPEERWSLRWKDQGDVWQCECGKQWVCTDTFGAKTYWRRKWWKVARNG